MLLYALVNISWARILKHLLEAEKSTFRGELSFQRSECTAGLTVSTILCVFYLKDFSVLTVWKHNKLGKMTLHLHFHWNICRFIWKPRNKTFSPAIIWKSLRIRAQYKQIKDTRGKHQLSELISVASVVLKVHNSELTLHFLLCVSVCTLPLTHII